MNWEDLFPDLTSENIFEAVNEMWDFESWAFPLPKFEPECACGERLWQARFWNFAERYSNNPRLQGRVKWRCNTSLKCLKCGHAVGFGIPVPAAYARERASWHPTPTIHWRDALAIAKEKGYESKEIGKR